jgi:hypothetical protein
MSKQPIRIGYCLSLTDPLASNGKTAPLTEKSWCVRALRAQRSLNHERHFLPVFLWSARVPQACTPSKYAMGQNWKLSISTISISDSWLGP